MTTPTRTEFEAAAYLQRIGDLLDAYRDETACETYNHWWRHRDPKEIRKELDTAIAAAMGWPTVPEKES